MRNVWSISGWRNFFKALLFVCVFFAAVPLLSIGISALPWIKIYKNQFVYTPGDWFAWRLNEAIANPENTCLLVGGSTVRLGLSPSILEEGSLAPKVVNTATTGGDSAVDVIEIQSRILASSGEHYKCILVGLHPVFLRTFDSAAYDLIISDWVAALSLKDIFDLQIDPRYLPKRESVFSKYLMPLGQQSLQLRRLLRLSLYKAHRALIDDSTPPKEFEKTDNEFSPQMASLYVGKPSILKEVAPKYDETLKRAGWDRPDLFGGQREASALKHALRLLGSITDRLVVVELPESYLYNSTDAIARPSYEAALSASTVTADVVRCQIPKAQQEEYFHDAIHLGEDGKAYVSRSIAHLLATGLPDEICTIRTKIRQ